MADVAGMATGSVRLGRDRDPAGFRSAIQDCLRNLAAEAEVVWVHTRDATRLAAAQLPCGTIKTTRLEYILEDASVQAVQVLMPQNMCWWKTP